VRNPAFQTHVTDELTRASAAYGYDIEAVRELLVLVLEPGVQRLARAAVSRLRHSAADPASVMSEHVWALWSAVRKLEGVADLPTWWTLLGYKLQLASTEAARADDVLHRRMRTARRAAAAVTAEREQSEGRTIDLTEQVRIVEELLPPGSRAGRAAEVLLTTVRSVDTATMTELVGARSPEPDPADVTCATAISHRVTAVLDALPQADSRAARAWIQGADSAAPPRAVVAPLRKHGRLFLDIDE
jgi:hypothetical protein